MLIHNELTLLKFILQLHYNLVNSSMDCNLTMEEMNQGESIISWSLPLSIKRNLLDIKNALYILHISHIGRPEKNIEKTCFMHSCQMNPFPTANQIIVRIQSMPIGDRNWIELKIPLVDSNCYLDCMWPNRPPYYQLSQQLNDYYSGQYSSYIISQSFKNNLQIVQCPIRTEINNKHTRLCQINPYFQLTEYAFCTDENLSVKTCFIPTCDETASIPCITLARSINVNSSTIQIEWLETQSLQQSNQFDLHDDLIRTNSYLFILYQLNESNKIKDRQCAQYTFVVISKDTQENWKNYFHDIIIQSLIHSCLGQTKQLFTDVKQSNVIIFEKLLPSTLYEISIIPFNKYGQPGASWSQEVITTIALPCKPESMEIYKIESHALSIKWYLSRNIYCGYPSRIHIYYKHIINSNQPMKEEEQQQQQWNNIDSEYTVEHVRLSSLRPCQTYCVKMKFINAAGSAFTNIPTLTSELIEINKSTDKQYQSDSSSLILRLRIHLNYTNYCPVLYEFLTNIYNDDVQNAVITVSPSPANFKFINFTVNVQRPIEISQSINNQLDHYQCFINFNNYTHFLLRNQHYINNSLLNKFSYCIELNWKISGTLNGLLGFIIQFFIPFKYNSLKQYQWINETFKNNPNELYLNKLTTIDTLNNELQQCVQLIWLPCTGCLHNYSLRNAHPRVIEKLRKLIGVCKLPQQSYQTFSRNYKTSQLSSINDLQIELNALQLNEFNQITLNQSTYKFDYYVINPTFIIFSQLSQATMIVKRGFRSVHQNRSSLSSSSSSSRIIDTQHNGYVIVYSVTADDVIYAIKHKWRLNGSEGDEEVGYELREKYKSPVIPLKIPRQVELTNCSQPDSINIHDFIKWSEKNINSLQEEFKSLNIHSYKQEQAKHLTCTIGQRPENRLRNKYRNLLPSLPDIGSEQWIPSNYMNASWIPSQLPGISSAIVRSGQLPHKYIAAQAPVDHTRSLFWQMIWDHHVQLIVTLTKTGTFICLDQLCQQVRYDLQPNLQIFLQKFNHKINEPIYVNLNKVNNDEVEDKDGFNEDEEEEEEEASSSPSLSMEMNYKNDKEICCLFTFRFHEKNLFMKDELYEDGDPSIHDHLLNGKLPEPIDNNKRTKKQFLFSRRNNKAKCINIFKSVLWLRSKRSHMVQTIDQYIFIYEFLASFIKQLKEEGELYLIMLTSLPSLFTIY
ncbi:Tyrosine-protein phosphatase non-receptor type 6 [Schistosoma japonicum]|nr:Tyrosine-protein phosphatase non-receptor type 6 [Schistosoma japonicum]